MLRSAAAQAVNRNRFRKNLFALFQVIWYTMEIYEIEEGGSFMHTNESAENYLETILILSESRPVVRAVDIAAELDFKKSSVSVAMKKLRESNHITVTPEGFIYLTESGKEIADRIYERHKLLSSWLERLGVDPEVAVADACRIEHVISAESFEAIKKHIL